MKLLKPFLAALLFFVLSVYFTYYFQATLQYLNLDPHSWLSVFVSSPFNMSTEGNLLYNLYIPTVLIFMVGVYLKNFNTAFQRKCGLRWIFIFSIAASYVKSILSSMYYVGYSDFGISLGTSIVTLSFMAALVISLEVYIERKEKYEHLYGHFMFGVLTSMVALLALFVFLSFFFRTDSVLVHIMGLTSFLIMFVPFYERSNIRKFMRKEERKMEHRERRRVVHTA